MTQTFATINPATGEVLRVFEPLTDDEARGALARSAQQYASWSRDSVKHRAVLLRAAAEEVRAHTDELARLTTLEMGKPISQARVEVALCASILDYYADRGPELLDDEVLDIAGAGRAVVRTAPIGPILGIMPWNFPYYQVIRFAAPNLLLGNTVLLKHAPNCPQQARRLEAVFRAAGFPDGVFQSVFATHEQVAEMIASPHLQGVSLTGSERAGRTVGALAGEHLKKCVLELGGSDPLIVLADADLDVAVPAAVAGRFGNAGQVCSSAKRMIVEEPVFDEFLERFLAVTPQWLPGDPTADETKMGPLSSTAAREELCSQIQDAVAKGAMVLTGGTVPEGPGAWFPPTVLTGVKPGMRAYSEELFGPVAVLYKVGSASEAVDLANDSPYGLGGSVFTRDVAAAHEIIDRLEVGMVGHNTTIKSAPDLPFGGVKNSGVGRELARFGLDEFSNKKLVRFAD